MDDSDIYICIPGEYVVLKSTDTTSSITGLLCVVDGIRKGKVQVSVLPHNSRRKENVTPLEIVDCGEYGDDENESTDEIDAAYKDFASGRDTMRRKCNEASDSSVRPDIYYQATKYYYEGSFQQSLELSVQSIGGCANPRMRGHLLALATRCCIAMGTSEQAHHYADANMRISVDSITALCHMGEVCLHEKQTQEAMSWFARAVNLDPLNPIPRFPISQLLLQDPMRRAECVDHLQACVTSCRITDNDYPPEQIIAMYISVSEMLGALGCDAELRVKALLRGVNVARISGALQEQRVSTALGIKAIVRELQNIQVRAKAAEVFHALGNLLQSICPGARDASSGYVHGAFAAYQMCNFLTDGCNVEYRSSLENISKVGQS